MRSPRSDCCSSLKFVEHTHHPSLAGSENVDWEPIEWAIFQLLGSVFRGKDWKLQDHPNILRKEESSAQYQAPKWREGLRSPQDCTSFLYVSLHPNTSEPDALVLLFSQVTWSRSNHWQCACHPGLRIHEFPDRNKDFRICSGSPSIARENEMGGISEGGVLATKNSSSNPASQ